MSETVIQASVQDQVLSLATSDPERFPVVFRHYRTTHPKEVTQACLLHLAECGLDEAGKKMILWLCLSADYLPVLLDPKLFSLQAARRLTAILYKADPQCLAKLVILSGQPDSMSIRRFMGRALELVDFFTDKDALVPWLRKLTDSSDVRLRSKAVKTLCELRPNRELIKRQLQSPDERIRASALEALWHQRTPEAEDFLRSALSDENHRVVANALVGLHLIGDETAFRQIAKHTEHASPMFRRAMIWALGYIGDRRGIPLLERLSNEDESPAVRSKAAKTLTMFPAEVASNPVPVPEAEVDKPAAEKPAEVPTIPKVAPHSDRNSENFGSFKLTLLK